MIGFRSITPTQVAYQAWQKSDKPIPYHTRDVNGNGITVSVDFLSPETHKAFDPTATGICLICAGEVTGGIPSGSLLGVSYTDWPIHKSPHSTHICKACAWALMMNVAAGRQTLYRYSFMASDTNGLQLLNRGELRDALIAPPPPPFVAVAAVSQKKHLVTKAFVSYSQVRYHCMLEEERISVVRDDLERYILVIEALRGLGCTKDEIETRSFRYERLATWGGENLERVLEILQPFARTRMLQLALFVAQKNEDEEDCKCYLDFKPVMKSSQNQRS